MNDINKMLKDFQAVQNEISTLIKYSDEKYILKKRILILAIFAVALTVYTVSGINGYISKPVTLLLIAGNLLWGLSTMGATAHLLEAKLISVYTGECNFWIEYQEAIRNDMRKAKVFLAGDNLIVHSKLDLVNSGIIILMMKNLCNAINVEKEQTFFKLPSRFPDDISEESSVTADMLIDWSNTIALVFVILYSDTIGLLTREGVSKNDNTSKSQQG